MTDAIIGASVKKFGWFTGWSKGRAGDRAFDRRTELWRIEQGTRLRRSFICYFYFGGWDNFSLGINLNVVQPNIEIHLPFGFIRLGWVLTDDVPAMNEHQCSWRRFGYGE